MLVKEAEQLIEGIYREKYIPKGLEASTIAEAREQIRQGKIGVVTGARLQEIYRKAAGG